MKTNSLILTVLAATAFVVAGCSKQEGSTAPPTDTMTPAASVDTSKLTAAFESAEPAVKSAVDTAVTAIKKADYSGAVTQLQELAKKYTLTDEQQTAVKDAIAAVQKAIADAAAKATSEASKAAGDLGDKLPK
jgi:PBP1b-binding outer membrane lipoprotein LpoB